MLSESFLNPARRTDTGSGTLAGRVASLNLNLGFDSCDNDFGSSCNDYAVSYYY